MIRPQTKSGLLKDDNENIRLESRGKLKDSKTKNKMVSLGL